MRRTLRAVGLVGLALCAGVAVASQPGPDLRCASAMCHSDAAMARLTPAYRTCMAGEAAMRRQPEALRDCAVAEARRQDEVLARVAREASKSLPVEAEPLGILAEFRSNWLAMRDSLCVAISLDYEGAARTAVEQQCRAYVTIERIMFLNHVVATESYF